MPQCDLRSASSLCPAHCPYISVYDFADHVGHLGLLPHPFYSLTVFSGYSWHAALRSPFRDLEFSDGLVLTQVWRACVATGRWLLGSFFPYVLRANCWCLAEGPICVLFDPGTCIVQPFPASGCRLMSSFPARSSKGIRFILRTVGKAFGWSVCFGRCAGRTVSSPNLSDGWFFHRLCLVYV